MPSLSIQNFGCRVNQAEAFAWAEAFRKGGLRLEDDSARSDFVLVNSCTLTGRADRDVRKFIQKISRENPAAKLVVTGCYAERARHEIETIPQVLLVVPNNEKTGLPDKMLALVGMTGSDERAEPGMADPEDLRSAPGRFSRSRMGAMTGVRSVSFRASGEEARALARATSWPASGIWSGPGTGRSFWPGSTYRLMARTWSREVPCSGFSA